MAKYFYERYALTKTYSNRRSGGEDTSQPMTPYDWPMYTSYDWTAAQGFYGTGSTRPLAAEFYSPYGGICYEIAPTVVQAVSSTNPAIEIYEGRYLDVSLSAIEICDYTNSKGAYLSTIEAEDGTYPDDGVQGGYWWVKGALVFPSLKLRVDGALKTSENGWVRVGGQLKEIESITVRINGALREVM